MTTFIIGTVVIPFLLPFVAAFVIIILIGNRETPGERAQREREFAESEQRRTRIGRNIWAEAELKKQKNFSGA